MYPIATAKSLEELHAFARAIHEHAQHCAGYPANLDFQLHDFFSWWVTSGLCDLHLNDVGRPEDSSPYQLNTHLFEREVLAHFASLYHFPPDGYWGYITSGSTQGIEQGLLMGRNVLRHIGEPIAYFSEESHYSVKNVLSLIDVEWRVISCLPSGEMDLVDLLNKLDTCRPALVNINIGTTFKGAIDNRKAILHLLATSDLPAHYCHLDAALFGGYLPYIEGESIPHIFFDKLPYDSITVSGHKFLGSPIPVGIFLMQKHHAKQIRTDYVEYLASDNLIIPCSRSSLNTLILWWIVHTKPPEEWRREVQAILENAQYLQDKLQERGYPCWRNPYSNIVYFRCPNTFIRSKWSLPDVMDRFFGKLSHIIAMQHVTSSLIDEFLHDLEGVKALHE